MGTIFSCASDLTEEDDFEFIEPDYVEDSDSDSLITYGSDTDTDTDTEVVGNSSHLRSSHDWYFSDHYLKHVINIPLGWHSVGNQKQQAQYWFFAAVSQKEFQQRLNSSACDTLDSTSHRKYCPYQPSMAYKARPLQAVKIVDSCELYM